MQPQNIITTYQQSRPSYIVGSTLAVDLPGAIASHGSHHLPGAIASYDPLHLPDAIAQSSCAQQIQIFMADFQRYFPHNPAYQPISSLPKFFIAAFQRYFLPDSAYKLISSLPKIFIAEFQRHILPNLAYNLISSLPKIFIAHFQRYFLENTKHQIYLSHSQILPSNNLPKFLSLIFSGIFSKLQSISNNFAHNRGID